MRAHLSGENLHGEGRTTELIRLLDNARKSDVIIVWKLERLARSIRQLIDTTALLYERGVELHLLTERSTPQPRRAS